jgi:colanic acid biosynthesis glycosyl transferase WcaI
MRPLGKRWRILTQYYPPEIGAPQVRLQALASELLKRGFAVEVLTAFPNYPKGHIYPGYKVSWQLSELRDGVRVRRVPIIPGTGKARRVRFTNYFSFTLCVLLPALFSGDCDVLFVESRPTLGMVAILMKWLRGIPYIYNVADLQLEAAQQLGLLKGGAIQRLAASMESLFLRESWKVSTVSLSFIEHFRLQGLSGKQITFLPNGADTDFLRPQPPDPELMARWHCGAKTVFLYAGTHGYIYGVDTLLHAAHKLRERSDLVFLIVGEGPERLRLIELGRKLELNNVIFADALPYKEMPRLYSLAYASIATLRNVELARKMRLAKIFPAFSCGVPVIFSGPGEIGDLIAKHACGLSVPPEDPDHLAHAIERLAADPLSRRNLGLNARGLAVREYDWSIIVENWLDELGYPRAPGSAHCEPSRSTNSFADSQLREAG